MVLPRSCPGICPERVNGTSWTAGDPRETPRRFAHTCIFKLACVLWILAVASASCDPNSMADGAHCVCQDGHSCHPRRRCSVGHQASHHDGDDTAAEVSGCEHRLPPSCPHNWSSPTCAATLRHTTSRRLAESSDEPSACSTRRRMSNQIIASFPCPQTGPKPFGCTKPLIAPRHVNTTSCKERTCFS